MEAPKTLESVIDAPLATYTVDGTITTGIDKRVLQKRFAHYDVAEESDDFYGDGTNVNGVWFYVSESNNLGVDINATDFSIGDEMDVDDYGVDDLTGDPVIEDYTFIVDTVQLNPEDDSWVVITPGGSIDYTDSKFRIGCLLGSNVLAPTSGTPILSEWVNVSSTNPDQTGVSFTIVEPFGYKIKINDWISFGNSSEVFQVFNITNETDSITQTTKVKFECLRNTAVPSPDPLSTSINSVVYLNSIGHHNAGTQAYGRGELETDLSTEKTYPKNKTLASNESINVDGDPIDVGTTNPNRLSYNYELIKNPEDFDYKLEQNALDSFLPGMKLKFYGRNPVESDIEIAISNWYDFETGSDNKNLAVAFEEPVGTQKEYTYLASLFDYAPLKGATPLDDELGIAIKYGDTIETFVVTLNPLSQDGNGKNNYIETVINENSNLVFVVDNVGIEDAPSSYLVVDKDGFDEFGNPVGNSTGIVTTTVLKIVGGRNPKNDQGGIQDAYFSVEDKEKYEIDVVIGNEEFPNIGIELADSRKDCIAYIGARYEDTVGKKAIDATNDILNYLKTGELTRTMFAADFANYFRVYDKFNKKYRWINCAGDMAGIRCDVTSNHDAWWVSAGMKRGIIRNINKLAFTPSQAQRDNLYKSGVNPIVSFPGTGNLVWGNKTLHPIASSFDRINVRTLFNTLERSMSKAARSQVFEFNDPYTRNAMLSMFNPYLSTIKAGRGITDYLVICDETNNTPDVISRNELRVDIYLKPNYAAEMILLTFTNVGTRSFSDVVGV